jgi:hypothetical protein
MFQGCIKQLTLNRLWTSGITFPLRSAGEAQSGGGNRPVHGAKKATELSAQIQNWPPNLLNRPQGLPTSFSVSSGSCLVFATTDVDLLLAVAHAIFEFP